jgi:hypothetical protein
MKKAAESNRTLRLKMMWKGPQCPDGHILVFHDYAFYHTLVTRAGIIHAHLLTSA